MSNSPLIPREKLSAYQRWELHAFDIPDDFDSSVRVKDGNAKDAAKIEGVRREAYASGRADGLREGAQKSAEDAQRLRNLLATMTQQSSEINQHLADDLLRFGLALARQMVRRSLTAHPDIIIPLVKDALTHLASANTPLSMTLHPADAVLVRAHLTDAIATGHWNLIEDADLQRGGCLLQTATSHMDATIGARWHHLASKLGIDDQWLD
ncbi:MAG: FliH/SctL family protein [Burkholderiales bacterium]